MVDPQDAWYRLVKEQAHRNAKRRGRRHYLVTLVRLKATFLRPRETPAARWPDGGPGGALDAALDAARWYDWPYVGAMVTFDALTPAFVVGHLALLMLLLVSVVTVTYMYMVRPRTGSGRGGRVALLCRRHSRSCSAL